MLKMLRNTNLRLHVRQHSGDKPFQCTVCTYKTGDKSALKRHIRKHTNDRPYKCELCSYASIQSGNLKKHIQSKHKTVEEVEEQQLPVVSAQKETKAKKKVISMRADNKQKITEEYTLHQDILVDKDKDVHSIHTLDSLLALAEQS